MQFGYGLNSYWGPRAETPQEIAGRCRTLLDRLAAISPIFTNWTYVVRKNPPPQQRYEGPQALAEYYNHRYQAGVLDPLTRDELAILVEAGVARADDDDPTPISGYRFSAYTRSLNDPLAISGRVHAGDSVPENFYVNSVNIETRPLCDENRAVFNLPLLQSAVLTIVDAWDVTWAAVYPAELMALWKKPYETPRPTFKMAWITYLSPRFAPMVTPPHAAIVEHTPQGGIVMTATKERFDIANPGHVGAAREIEAALAPVNALPWPPDAESR